MKERPSKNGTPQFLSGWKEIANYLGKGVRTVQRYEREFGLPIRRPAAKPWGSVLATKAELDAWVKASPIREVFRLRPLEVDCLPEANVIKDGLSQMRRLREEMFALRSELTASVQVLHRTVSNLQNALASGGGAKSITDRNTIPHYRA